jgi:hypothetical protein
VTWQALPSAYYKAIIALIGVPSSGVAGIHSICHNAYSSTLRSYGFKTLVKATTEQGSSSDPVPGESYCRQL